MNQVYTQMRKFGLCVGAVLAGVTLAGCGPTASSSASVSNTSTSAVPAADSSNSPSVGSSSGAAAGGSTASSAVSGTTGGSGGGGGSTSACTTADLSLKVFEGPQEGGSNSVGAYIVLTNTSESACTTVGYPGVDFYSGDTDLGKQTTRQGSGTATTITLEPGGQATSYFTYPMGKVCDAAADTVQVIPPNQTTALRSKIDYIGDGGATPPSSFSVCDGDIGVSPLVSGYDGPH